MPHNIACDFPVHFDAASALERLGRVIDPELDESIIDLGFVRALRLTHGHAEVALQLPTSWCAVNFAYLMAEDVRRALLGVDGIRRATIRLGDHCAAREIETAVNAGRPFVEAFPEEGAGSLATLRLTFLRKGFFIRQERLLKEMRAAGWAPAVLCALRLDNVSIENDAIVIRPPGAAPQKSGPAEILRRYLKRRAELDIDCRDCAWLIVDLDGKPFSEQGLEAHYEAARTMRVAMEANGSFCRALLSVRHLADPAPPVQDL
jgi:metal-sulfur cluster biosynthetic enzyme